MISRASLAISLLPVLALAVTACSKKLDAAASGGPGADLII
ncbi:MAG: hypothetical protein RL490_1842, partial [Pseudomonadota bacterium]